jgi:hypothetical protein
MLKFMASPHEEDYADLRQLDLRQLDLSEIELDIEQRPSPWRRVFSFLTLAGLGLAIFWFPQSDFYRREVAGSGLLALVSMGAILTGILLGRWLWSGAEASAQRWIQRHPEGLKPRNIVPPGPAQRWFALLAFLGGCALLFFVLLPLVGSSTFSDYWYVATIVAMGVGLMLGRWLLLQAHNPFKREATSTKRELPPWFRWVSLALIIVASVLILFGGQWFNTENNQDLEFALGGGGFAIGVMGAIWMAKRFDELEASIRKK